MVNFIYSLECIYLQRSTAPKAVWSFRTGKLNCYFTHSVHSKSTKTLQMVNLICYFQQQDFSHKNGVKAKLSLLRWTFALSSLLTSRRAARHSLCCDVSNMLPCCQGQLTLTSEHQHLIGSQCIMNGNQEHVTDVRSQWHWAAKTDQLIFVCGWIAVLTWRLKAVEIWKMGGCVERLFDLFTIFECGFLLICYTIV